MPGTAFGYRSGEVKRRNGGKRQRQRQRLGIAVLINL